MDSPSNGDLFRVIQAWVGSNYDGDFATKLTLQLASGGDPISLPVKRMCNQSVAGGVLGNNHSSDYRSCRWKSETYTFTPKQAEVVRVLWEAFDDDAPAVGQAAILEQIESAGTSVRNLFRGHPAWGTMVVCAGKGAYRLSE